MATDFAVAMAVHGLVHRLYGHTEGRASYRVRLRPDLLAQYRRFFDENGRVFGLEPKQSFRVNDKAFIVAKRESRFEGYRP